MARVKVCITGIPGSGKSTLLGIFKEMGFPVIDADKVGHGVLEEVSDKIVEAFGREVLNPDGTVNRKALGVKVFKDPTALKKLEAIVVPRIAFNLGKLMEGAPGDVVFVEAAMLFEYGLDKLFDLTVAVVAPEEEAKRRAAAKMRYPVTVIEGMLKRQLPQDEKARRADIVVRNLGSLEGLRNEAQRVLEEIRGKLGQT